MKKLVLDLDWTGVGTLEVGSYTTGSYLSFISNSFLVSYNTNTLLSVLVLIPLNLPLEVSHHYSHSITHNDFLQSRQWTTYKSSVSALIYRTIGYLETLLDGTAHGTYIQFVFGMECSSCYTLHMKQSDWLGTWHCGISFKCFFSVKQLNTGNQPNTF